MIEFVYDGGVTAHWLLSERMACGETISRRSRDFTVEQHGAGVMAGREGKRAMCDAVNRLMVAITHHEKHGHEHEQPTAN